MPATKKPAARKPAAEKQTAPTPAPSPEKPRGFIDAAMLAKAVELRAAGKSWNAIGADLGVKSTAYLSARVKAEHGAVAAAKPAAQTVPQAEPADAVSEPARPARRRTSKPPAGANPTAAKGS